MASVHDGHRARMRDKIRKGGLGSFQQHEILEYLLFSFVPRKDTNEIAHALIDKFSSLSGVLNASEEDLEKVSGMTQNAALFLATLPDVFRAYVDGVNSDGANRQDLSGRGKARNFMCAQGCSDSIRSTFALRRWTLTTNSSSARLSSKAAAIPCVWT